MAWNYLTLKSPKGKRLLGYLLGLSSFILNYILVKKGKYGRVKSILVIKLDHLGDVLLATPVFENLRMEYPNANISVMVGSWAKPIVEGNPYIDEIIIYDSTFYDRKGRENTKILSNIQRILALRKKEYDLLVDLRPSPGTLLLAVISLAKYRYDRSTVSIKNKIRELLSRDLGGRLIRHEVEQNLDILRSFGMKVKDCRPGFYVSNSDDLYGRSILKINGVRQTDFSVAMCAGGDWEYRRWKTERFAKIADWLIRCQKAKVIILGSSEDYELGQEVCSRMQEKQINLVGKTTLKQLAAIIRHCKLFIGNESGPMHIAASMGTHVISLFGPQSSERFRPFCDRSTVIEVNLNCKPCDQVKCKRPHDPCINKISVEDVIQAIERIKSTLPRQ